MAVYGITFAEEMSGPFALGSSNPEIGAKLGRERGHTLVMRASINIDNIDQFIDDEEHAGKIAGTLDFTPFGSAIKARKGVFKLFAPVHGRETKRMDYEFGFEHNGRPWYLAGHKIVHDDPGLDLLVDTTTLYTCLHEGPDAHAPVAGAGILTLGVWELISLLRTLRATGADVDAGRAAALVRFGKFFAGELWDTYGP